MKNSDKARLKKVVNRFNKMRMLVIGDIMVDEYIWGSVTRISPEAPIPVVEVKKDEFKPGGAANVMLNLADLGAKVYAAGVVGSDFNAHKLVGYIKKHKIDTSSIIVDHVRPTTIKTRVLAHSQQIVRIDREHNLPVSKDKMKLMIKKLKAIVKKVDGIIFSDYGKGVITRELFEAVMEGAKGKTVTADPKPQNARLFRRVDLITPNKKEAEQASGIKIHDEKSLLRAGAELRDLLGAKAILITRGEEGMSLFEGGSVTHIPTVAREVYDVTGAGDTVISVASLALAAKADPKDAALISNIAAGEVVAEVGVATLTQKELNDAIQASK
jgi:D-glycero-beta-D-manno-heptose-7-phosphate kinase